MVVFRSLFLLNLFAPFLSRAKNSTLPRFFFCMAAGDYCGGSRVRFLLLLFHFIYVFRQSGFLVERVLFGLTCRETGNLLMVLTKKRGTRKEFFFFFFFFFLKLLLKYKKKKKKKKKSKFFCAYYYYFISEKTQYYYCENIIIIFPFAFPLFFLK